MFSRSVRQLSSASFVALGALALALSGLCAAFGPKVTEPDIRIGLNFLPGLVYIFLIQMTARFRQTDAWRSGIHLTVSLLAAMLIDYVLLSPALANSPTEMAVEIGPVLAAAVLFAAIAVPLQAAFVSLARVANFLADRWLLRHKHVGDGDATLRRIQENAD
jgi:hypothetical protein